MEESSIFVALFVSLCMVVTKVLSVYMHQLSRIMINYMITPIQYETGV